MSLVISVCSDGLHPDLTVPSALIPLVKVLADIDPSAPSLRLKDDWTEAELLPQILLQLRDFACDYDIDPLFADDIESHFADDPVGSRRTMRISSTDTPGVPLSRGEISYLLTQERDASVAQGRLLRMFLTVTFSSHCGRYLRLGLKAAIPTPRRATRTPRPPRSPSSPRASIATPRLSDIPVAVHALGALREAMYPDHVPAYMLGRPSRLPAAGSAHRSTVPSRPRRLPAAGPASLDGGIPDSPMVNIPDSPLVTGLSQIVDATRASHAASGEDALHGATVVDSADIETHAYRGLARLAPPSTVPTLLGLRFRHPTSTVREQKHQVPGIPLVTPPSNASRPSANPESLTDEVERAAVVVVVDDDVDGDDDDDDDDTVLLAHDTAPDPISSTVCGDDDATATLPNGRG